jgi:hypothetical protein
MYYLVFIAAACQLSADVFSSISANGICLEYTGCLLSSAGSLLVGYRSRWLLFVPGCRLLFVGCQLLLVGCQLLLVGCQLLLVGCGCSLPMSQLSLTFSIVGAQLWCHHTLKKHGNNQL